MFVGFLEGTCFLLLDVSLLMFANGRERVRDGVSERVWVRNQVCKSRLQFK